MPSFPMNDNGPGVADQHDDAPSSSRPEPPTTLGLDLRLTGAAVLLTLPRGGVEPSDAVDLGFLANLEAETIERRQPVVGGRLRDVLDGRRHSGIGAQFRAGNVEATTGVEPVNSGFADRRVRPLRHVAAVVRRSGYGGCWLPLEDSNLGSRIQSPLSYH